MLLSRAPRFLDDEVAIDSAPAVLSVSASSEVRAKPKYKMGTTPRWLENEQDNGKELATDCQGAPHWNWKENLRGFEGKFRRSERFHQTGTKCAAFTNPGDSNLDFCKLQHGRCSVVMRKPLIDRRPPISSSLPRQRVDSRGSLKTSQNITPIRRGAIGRPGRIPLHRQPNGRFGLKVVDGELRTPEGQHRVVSIDGKRLDSRRLIALASRIYQGPARCMMIERGRPRPTQIDLGSEGNNSEDGEELMNEEREVAYDKEEKRSNDEPPQCSLDKLETSEPLNMLTAAALSKLDGEKPVVHKVPFARNASNPPASEISTGASTAVHERPVRSTATFGQSKRERFETRRNDANPDWSLNPIEMSQRVKGGSIMPPHHTKRASEDQAPSLSEIEPDLNLVRERAPNAVIMPVSMPLGARMEESSCGPGSYDLSPPSPGPCSAVMRMAESRERHSPHSHTSLPGPGPGTYEVTASECSREPSLIISRAPRFSRDSPASCHEIGGYELKPRRRRSLSAVILPTGIRLATMMREIHPEPGTYTPQHLDIHRPDVGILQWSWARDVAIRYAHERLYGESRRQIDNWEVRAMDLASPNHDRSVRRGSVSLVDYERSAKAPLDTSQTVPRRGGYEDTWSSYDFNTPECGEFTAFFGCKQDFDQWKKESRRHELQRSIGRRRNHPQCELFAYSLPELPKGVEVDFGSAQGRRRQSKENTDVRVEGDVLMLDPEVLPKNLGGVPFHLQEPRDDPEMDMNGDVLILSPKKLSKNRGGAIKLDLQPAREIKLQCDVAGVGPVDQVYTTEPPRRVEADDASEECLLHFKESDRTRPLGHLPKWLLRMKQQKRSELPVVEEI